MPIYTVMDLKRGRIVFVGESESPLTSFGAKFNPAFKNERSAWHEAMVADFNMPLIKFLEPGDPRSVKDLIAEYNPLFNRSKRIKRHVDLAPKRPVGRPKLPDPYFVILRAGIRVGYCQGYDELKKVVHSKASSRTLRQVFDLDRNDRFEIDGTLIATRTRVLPIDLPLMVGDRVKY